MNLYKIEAGNFRLDGGAMFGIIPKSLWSKTNHADQNNLIDIASRCLLIEENNRLILVDTGMGNKQSEKFFSFYHRWGNFDLIESIKKQGFGLDEITDVLITHMHFDHCGGLTSLQGEKAITNFPNAKIWTNSSHWDWANTPNVREAPSFRKDNLEPILQSGMLNFVDFSSNFTHQKDLPFEIVCVDGHTEKQMLPKVKYKGYTLVFVADLIPTIGHIPLVYSMGYDTRPLLTMEEKKLILEEAAEKNYLLFFEHDAHNELCTVKKSQNKVVLDEVLYFDDL